MIVVAPSEHLLFHQIVVLHDARTPRLETGGNATLIEDRYAIKRRFIPSYDCRARTLKHAKLLFLAVFQSPFGVGFGDLFLWTTHCLPPASRKLSIPMPSYWNH